MRNPQNNPVWKVAAVCVLSCCLMACSDGDAGSNTSDGSVDAETDAHVDAGPQATIGEFVELPLLPGDDPGTPFNHSTEPSIAVYGDHVVAGYINLGLNSADSFQYTNLERRVAVACSHDGGESFASAINPEIGDQTSDPVVRVNSLGDFFLSVVNPTTDIVLGKSTDHGESWTSIAAFPGYDKEWMAVSNQEQRVYIGCTNGFWVFDYDGLEIASATAVLMGLNIGGYADDSGAYFAVGGGRGDDLLVVHWDGSADPVQEGSCLPMGVSEYWNNVAASIGPKPGGGHWIVRSVETGAYRQVMLRVRNLPGDEGEDIPITPSDRNAFLPAAAADESGRLVVVWYETDANSNVGVLKLARTKSADWSDGFDEPIRIDEAACPGNEWFPSSESGVSDRRLREYIDIAVTGNRAHVIWTHAPIPPARVRTVAVQFAD